MTDRSTTRLDPSVAAELLGRASYMLLTTFRRDGTPVPTAVWVMPADPQWPGTAGDQLWVWTNPAAGKVKRLRRDGACVVAPCTVRGEPLGRSVPAVGRVLPASSVDRVLAALVRKYGLRGRFATLGPRWGFAPSGALGIRLTPASDSVPTDANHAVPNHAVPNHAVPNHAVPNHAVPNHAVPTPDEDRASAE